MGVCVCLYDMLERPVLHHEILQFVDFQDGERLSCWNFTTEILSANHFRDMFYVIKLNFMEIGGNVAEISHFLRF